MNPCGQDARRPSRAGDKTALAVCFHTIGCKVNQYDTQLMREQFEASGYTVVDFGDRASSVAVVNTCSVTGRSSQKSRQAVARARRMMPGARIVAVGCDCLESSSAAELLQVADRVLGNDEKRSIVRAAGLEGRETGVAGIAHFSGRYRALVKVQDGCDWFCAYCRVPFVRGRARSRPRAEVLAEVERLALGGHREVVLTGVNLGTYGLDRSGKRELAGLLQESVSRRWKVRFRLSSLEATELTDELLELMAGESAICPHLHLPVQSGSDEVLKAMGRRYTAGGFLAAVDRARRRVRGLAVTTDLMVGFPGETDEMYRESLGVVERARFSRLHVFPYSRRPGTRAAELPGEPPERVKMARRAGAAALGRRLAAEYGAAAAGQEREVIVDRETGPGLVCGYSEDYLRVELPAGTGAGTGQPGELVRVRLSGRPGTAPGSWAARSTISPTGCYEDRALEMPRGA